MPHHKQKHLFFLVSFSLLSTFYSNTVHCQNAFSEEPLLEEPHIAKPWWSGQFHVGTTLTLNDDHSCPNSEECIIGDGALLGGGFEYRFPNGFAFAFGYDLNLLNGNSVYEVSVIQLAKVGIRYVFLPNNSFRPKLGVDGGFLLLGDTFEVDTFGGSFDAILSAEWEINAELALTPSIFGRFIALSKFKTEPDNEIRSKNFGVDVILGVQVGLLFLDI